MVGVGVASILPVIGPPRMKDVRAIAEERARPPEGEHAGVCCVRIGKERVKMCPERYGIVRR